MPDHDKQNCCQSDETDLSRLESNKCPENRDYLIYSKGEYKIGSIKSFNSFTLKGCQEKRMRVLLLKVLFFANYFKSLYRLILLHHYSTFMA